MVIKLISPTSSRQNYSQIYLGFLFWLSFVRLIIYTSKINCWLLWKKIKLTWITIKFSSFKFSKRRKIGFPKGLLKCNYICQFWTRINLKNRPIWKFVLCKIQLLHIYQQLFKNYKQFSWNWTNSNVKLRRSSLDW